MRAMLVVFGLVTLLLKAAPAEEPTAAPDPIRALLFDRAGNRGNSFSHMVDPPLWANTRYLLEGESHELLLARLEDLLARDIRQTEPNQRRRTLLQHQLWQVFDWTTQHDLRDQRAVVMLRKKLATAIRHVSLTRQQIDALPTNLPTVDAEDAPPNLLDERLGWVSLGLPDSTPVAQRHMVEFKGRSVFGVFIRHVDGPQAAKAFLKRLAAAPLPVQDQHQSDGFFAYDASLPQFPPGTKLALLRRMVLISRDGELICSPIVQSLQVRTFLRVEPRVLPGHVRMQEFTLDRDRYVAGEKTALRTVGPDDREPIIFLSHDIDEFEAHQHDDADDYRPPPLVLERCAGCHRDSGVLSMHSFTRFFSGMPAQNVRLDVLPFEREIACTTSWKRQHASWEMLRGHWEATLK